MTDAQSSMESMAGSLDALKRRFESFNPTAQAQSRMGYVNASVSFQGAVAFDIDPAATDPTEEVDLEVEVIEAYNNAMRLLEREVETGVFELLPQLANRNGSL